ncbi:MAG: hypothetical protein Q8889_00030 [Candidatus Phytoplasma australasiaticum]|nr:hypothetical protein [Candidatus Phytoplasma australasiaticum]MDV3199504.1 hypothetical protein [Candidatus Phytoplasma australasiaticum]
MHKEINNIKKFFNIKNSLNIFLILILFTFNYVTLNSKFLLKANDEQKTTIAEDNAEDILKYLKEIKNNPEIEKNSSLLSKCNDLINEYDQIKQGICMFFNTNQQFQQLKVKLFDQKDNKISDVKNKINQIHNTIDNISEDEDKTSLKTTLKPLDDSIEEYLKIIENLIETISYLQNTVPEEITMNLLTDNLTKFKDIYDNFQNKKTNLEQLIQDAKNQAFHKNLNNLKIEIEELETAIETLSKPVQEQLITTKIIDATTSIRGLSLNSILAETLGEDLTKLIDLKTEIDQVLNTDNNSNTNTNNTNNTTNNNNFKISSDNNSSLATKLFYLLCVIITITFLIIIYQFNKKPQHKNHL